MSNTRHHASPRALRWGLLLCLVGLLGGCSRSRASAEAYVDAPTTDAGRSSAVVPTVDLPDAAWAGGATLGIDVRRARPALTDRCVQDHYAERLSPRFLRLSCTVDVEGSLGERLRIGIVEGDDHAELAYVVRQIVAPPETLPTVLGLSLAAARARYGEPLADADGVVLWRGHAVLGDDATSVELRVGQERDGSGVVSETYRLQRLVGMTTP